MIIYRIKKGGMTRRPAAQRIFSTKPNLFIESGKSRTKKYAYANIVIEVYKVF